MSAALLLLWLRRASLLIMVVMLLVGRIPALRPYSRRIMLTLLALYLAGWVSVVMWRLLAGPGPFMAPA